MLALQSSERDYERTVINTVHNILELKGAIESSSKDHVDEEIDTTDTMLSNDRSYNTKGLYDITFDMNYNIQINSNHSKQTKHISLEKDLIKQIVKRLKMDDYKLLSSTLKCFTVLSFKADCEPNIDSPNQKCSFRSDPMFHGSPWLDWCIIGWIGNDNIVIGDDGSELNNDVETLYPAQILMFIDPSHMLFDVDEIESTKGYLWAVIRSTTNDNRRSTDSRTFQLMKRYQIEDKIRIINCDNIVKDAYVVADIDTMLDTSVQMPNRSNLCKIFQTNHVICLEDQTSWSSKYIHHKWNMN